jgi:hypothetical protein
MQAPAQRVKRTREDVRKRREQFDQNFKQTPFEKLISELPIRKPPLYVEQYITNPGSHKLYTAVARKRFFCTLTPGQRALAVQVFYRDASKVFRAGGVKDFVQVVTPLAETTERLPALAVARHGSVQLTGLGRARGRC